jgi:AcrR family transcriptional regulator
MRATANASAEANRNGPVEDLETRDRILRAARDLFRERGYDGTAMSQVAKAAGVTTPALYWHFASKAELCADFLERDYREFHAALVERSVGDTATERLRAYAAAFVEMQLRSEDRDVNFSYSQFRDRLTEEARESVKQQEREIIGIVQAILRDGQENGEFSITEPTVTAFAIVSMCEYVFVWFNPNGRLSASEVAALYADHALTLVRAG